MYQVIARKYRPQTFDDVLNQEHVKVTLANAIRENRIAHGYIFSGQRGTGKTTVARILARCLNCLDGPTTHPCGVCSSCLEIAQSGAVDVIEIDAASNRGINEMRELRENVRYQPARDRFKVFIIDEAHQITNEAFNALLKTIEEPPSWAVFILCTTEAHKIPATIASRCQHFSFRSVDFENLIQRMREICRQESIEADDESLSVLAQAGEGSVRDSLSALDQAIACCGSVLKADDVRALLGGFSLDSLDQVTQALRESHPATMLHIVDDLERNGRNLQHFSRELSRYFRNLLVAKVGETRLIAASHQERQRLSEAAAAFSEEDLTRYLQLSLDLFKDLQFSLQPRLHLELGLVRMVYAGRLMSIEEALAGVAPPAAEPKTRAAAPPGEPQRTAPPRDRPSPFSMDSQKKAQSAPPAAGRPTETLRAVSDGATALAPIPESSAAPSSETEWRDQLHRVLLDLGMAFTADGVEHSSITVLPGELHFSTPKDLMLGMKADDINQAVKQIAGRPMRIKVTALAAGTEAAAPVERRAKPAAAAEDEVTERALANEEVQKFRRLFGGQVRMVRNLKES
ncbi:MAG: DNA polymerase III subunit gamma/tau [Bryobacteraceae bacterium]